MLPVTADGHRQHPPRVRVVPANPGHAEAGMIHQNLGDFLEQCVPRRQPDDRVIHAAQRRIQPVQAREFLFVLFLRGNVTGDF